MSEIPTCGGSAHRGSGSGVEFVDGSLRGGETEGRVEQFVDLGPIGVGVEVDADPSGRTEIGGYEDSCLLEENPTVSGVRLHHHGLVVLHPLAVDLDGAAEVDEHLRGEKRRTAVRDLLPRTRVGEGQVAHPDQYWIIVIEHLGVCHDADRRTVFDVVPTGIDDETLRSPAVTASEDSPPTTLVLIRHGESNVTVNRVLGGYRTCSGLSPLGVEQVQRLCGRFLETGELRPDVLISSNFQRAIETAELIAPAFEGIEIEVDPAFGEHDPGPDLDGITFVQYVDRFGNPDWTSDPHAEVFPGGETLAAFHHRVGAAISQRVRQHAGQTIVISCHGGVIDGVFRQLLRTAPTGVFELNTDNTAITEFRLTRAGRWRLVRYNDSTHLHGLPTHTPRADTST